MGKLHKPKTLLTFTSMCTDSLRSLWLVSFLRPMVLNLWIGTIGKHTHIFLVVLGTSNRKFILFSLLLHKCKLVLSSFLVPKTLRSACFPMVEKHCLALAPLVTKTSTQNCQWGNVLITDSEWDKTIYSSPGSLGNGLFAICWVWLPLTPNAQSSSSPSFAWGSRALCLLGKCLWSIFAWVFMLSTQIFICLTQVLISSFVWSVVS